MITQTAADRRAARADAIPLSAIKPDGNGGYWVPASSGNRSYYVTAVSCTCLDFARRGAMCKHILAIERLCPLTKFVGDPFEGFENPAEPPAPPSLEEEQVALEARREYLQKRKDSADRGYGRFSSLNAQTYRHKIARILERQMEIRGLLK